MTIPDQSRMRVPGPLGFPPGGAGGRLPGSLGFASVVVAQVVVTKIVTTSTQMPPPTKTSQTLEARQVAWDLFKGDPAPRQVRQGELATCPIAAILAAFAHTPWGRTRIGELVAETKAPGAVETTLSAAILAQLKRDDPDYRVQQPKIVSDRYFTVKINNSPIDVSDVFFVEYTDGTALDPLYMQHRPRMSPATAIEALWPAAIEKAYAATIGDYEKLDDYTGPNSIKVDVFWTALAGSKPTLTAINDKTDDSRIRKIAEAASRIPAVAASREKTTKVLDKHGFAILGIQDSRIDLYDPHGKSLKISLQDFRADFELILTKP